MITPNPAQPLDAALVAVITAYESLAHLVTRSTERLLEQRSFWTDSQAVLDAYAETTHEDPELEGLAHDITLLRSLIKSEVESTGGQMVIGKLTGEAYRARMGEINGAVGALRQATDRLTAHLKERINAR